MKLSITSIVVKLVAVGSLSIAHNAGGAYGVLPVSLVAVPSGFRPTRYHWKVGEGSSLGLSASGDSVSLDILIGSNGNLHYDHRFVVVASDQFGNTAMARYTLHLEPPKGFLFVRYDDPHSRVGARTGSNGTGLSRVAYMTVLTETRTEGLLGRVNYSWSPAPVKEMEISPDFDQCVFRMNMNGDPVDVESYEGVLVKVHAIDEIGQSVSIEKFVDAITEVEEIEDETQRP